jgi:WD40 repeat protein
MRKIMNFQKRDLLVFVLGLLVLSSCNKTIQETETVIPTDTPDLSYPAPLQTDSQMSGYPPVVKDSTSEDAYPAPILTVTPTMEGSEFMELITEFTLDAPARLQWCSDQTCISVIGYDYLKVLSYPDFNELFSYENGENEFLLDISSDGGTYATTNNNEDLLLRNWELKTENVIPTGTFFMSAEFSPDGSKIMVTSMDEWGALIFDMDTGAQIVKLTGFETAAPVYDVRFGQSNDYAIWISRATIQVSEIATNQLLPAIYHQDFIMGFDLNAEGTLLATSAAEAVNDEFMPTVFLYDFKSGELIQKFTTTKAVYGIQFSPDNLKLAFSLGNSISLYDLETQQVDNQFVTETEAISQVLFSPDGSILVSVGEGLNLKFFQLNE